jgi:HPt (histidine-containing phosphotransfer) domain-containing protein
MDRKAESSPSDWAAILARAGERQTRFLRHLIPWFLIECPQQMTAISQAIADGDADRLKYSAHTLKGAMLFLAGNAVTEIVQRLETMGGNQDLVGAGELFPTLERAVNELLPALAEFARSQGSGVRGQESGVRSGARS